MEVVTYLHAILCPLEDGWRGGAGAGMRSDARGQRHEAITASVNAQMAWNQRQQSHLFSPGCGSCTWCLPSWWALSSLDLNRSDSGPPLLQSADRRLKGAGSDGRQRPAPPRFSQSHRRGSLVDAWWHLNVNHQSIRGRKCLFLITALYIIYYYYNLNRFQWHFPENVDNGT